MAAPAYGKRGYRYIPQNKYLAIVALVALCLSVIEIVDFIEFPIPASIGWVVASGTFFSINLFASLTNLGYGGLFLLMVLESASLPVPSEVVLPFAGYLVFIGSMNFFLALGVSTVAGLVGAFIDYYLALKLGRPFVERTFRYFGLRPKHLDDAENWLSSRGSWSVLVARFVPGLRSIISIPAGVFKMRVRPFFVMTLVGSFAWSGLLIYLGYSAGKLWQAALSSLSSVLNQAAPFLVAAISVGYIVYFLLPPSNQQRTASPASSGPRRILTFSYWQSFLKFNLVGVSGVIVNEGILILLTFEGIYYLYSSAVAIETSIISNFLLNDYWTFRDRRRGHIAVRLAKFNLSMLAGLAVNLLVVYIATASFGIHYAISNLIGIALAFLLRYALSVKYTWMREAENP